MIDAVVKPQLLVFWNLVVELLSQLLHFVRSCLCPVAELASIVCCCGSPRLGPNVPSSDAKTKGDFCSAKVPSILSYETSSVFFTFSAKLLKRCQAPSAHGRARSRSSRVAVSRASQSKVNKRACSIVIFFSMTSLASSMLETTLPELCDNVLWKCIVRNRLWCFSLCPLSDEDVIYLCGLVCAQELRLLFCFVWWGGAEAHAEAQAERSIDSARGACPTHT